MIYLFYLLYGIMAAIMDSCWKLFAEKSNTINFAIASLFSILATGTWVLILKKNIKLSTGVSLAVLTNLLFAVCIGLFVFNEKLSIKEFVGIGLAVFAVLFLGIK